MEQFQLAADSRMGRAHTVSPTQPRRTNTTYVLRKHIKRKTQCTQIAKKYLWITWPKHSNILNIQMCRMRMTLNSPEGVLTGVSTCDGSTLLANSRTSRKWGVHDDITRGRQPADDTSWLHAQQQRCTKLIFASWVFLKANHNNT